jgi:hypothetical protein
MLFIILIGILLHIILMRSDRTPDGTHFGIMNRSGKGGGSSTTVVQNTPASSAQSAESIQAWVDAMPKVFQTEMQYAPQQAAQQVGLAQQYALPLAQAYQSANEVLYPGTSALQETMAGQAQQGMTATSMPDWMAKSYLDEMKANLGSNVSSPIGADYVSRGMQNQLFNQQKYYRDLGLSLAGRQPLASPTMPQTSNFTNSFTPGSFMNWMSGSGNQTSNTKTSGGGLFGGLFG